MQIFYTVRAGDTLYNISLRWNIPLVSLINANNIPYPHNIYVGQQLSMPPGITNYVVKPNDSVYLISKRYGIPVNVIIAANGLEPPYTIMSDQVLIIPEGVPYYVVKFGDSLYKIAVKYNVVLNGQPRPDFIIKANPGLTSSITPGTTIAIPYPPPGGTGKLGVILNDSLSFYLGLYGPNTGKLDSMSINGLDESSTLFYSPDQTQIALIGTSGIIAIMNLSTMKTSRIDQTTDDKFIDWSPDSRNVVYSNGRIIRIYNVFDHTFKTVSIEGAQYVQYFPSGAELLYEAKDATGISQLYKINTNGTNKKQLTKNTEFPLHEVRLSPNGKFVLYTSPGASISEIYSIELATGVTHKIPGGLEGKNYNPTWSPDSTKIAYSSTHYINKKYYSFVRLTSPTGQNDSNVAISSCFSSPITWSTDGRKIVYSSGCREDANFGALEIWCIDIGNMVPINLLSGFMFYDFDWSPTR